MKIRKKKKKKLITESEHHWGQMNTSEMVTQIAKRCYLCTSTAINKYKMREIEKNDEEKRQPQKQIPFDLISGSSGLLRRYNPIH